MSKHKKYAVRIPRYAKGIRMQECRGGADGEWWTVRWRETLEKMGIAGRLGRGRHYAVSGQVTELVIDGPEVIAKVQGTREAPYEVRVNFTVPENEVRREIVKFLCDEPIRLARLAADDLPMEIEGEFRRHGAHLFPGGKRAPKVYDMTTSCSCPDYANPCKHVMAVLLVLGEEIARRPATLLELRGIPVEELYDEN